MINPQKPDFENTPANPLRVQSRVQLLNINKLPVISIVTPFYNTGAVFHETAKSIFNQSFQQWEWLIINDGSSDSQSLKLLAEYRKLDSRIKVIDHPDNRGLSAARNTGINRARCKNVILLDSDDLLEPSAAEKWWWFLETHPQFSFVASYHVAFGGLNYLWSGGFHDGAMNLERNRISMMCMIRKSVHTAVGGFDESIRGGLEDWEFWMRCAASGYWGATIPEYLAWYRVRQDHSDRWKNLQKKRIQEFRSSFKRKYPQLYKDEFPDPVKVVDLDLTGINLKVPSINLLRHAAPHLLIILPWLVMGGAERFVLNLLDQLVLKGWKISILTTAPSKNEWLPEFEKRTPDVYLLPNFLPVKDYPRFIGYLIQSRSVDCVMLQGSPEGYRLLPGLRAMFPRLQIFDYLHFVTPDWMDGGFPNLSLLYRDGLNFNVASCNQVRDWMKERGADGKKISVCTIGVDPQTWKPDAFLRQKTRKELGIAPDEVVILYAARLEEQKQPQIFVQTLSKLAQAEMTFRALVAGEGSLRADLVESLKHSGLNQRVKVLGGVALDRMPEIMASADIFFLPSKNEGVSQAIYEAMACGLVVVGAKVGGQAELVTKSCGVLLPLSPAEQQPEAYARVLKELIRDEAKRKRMGELSRKRIIEHFTLAHMGSCMSDLLSERSLHRRQGRAVPVDLSGKQQITREIQTSIEYLQARQEWHRINNRFSEQSGRNFGQLQQMSVFQWFTAGIRLLSYPVYRLAGRTRFNRMMIQIKRGARKLFNRRS